MNMACTKDILPELAQHLKCCICYCIFTDPVTASCGRHNYCMNCLTTYQEKTPKENCPQCRETRRRDNKLQKNVTLCHIVDVLPRDTWEFLLNNEQNYNLDSDVLDSSLMDCDNEQVGHEILADPSPPSAVYEVADDTDLSAMSPLEEPSVFLENPAGTFSETQSAPGGSEVEEEHSPNSLPDPDFEWLTFSPRHGNKKLCFLQENRRVEVRKAGQNSPARHNHFSISQVLAEQEFARGKHWWEVDTANSDGWAVGVAHPSLGYDDQLGRTSTSWCLEWSSKRLCYWHNKVCEHLSDERPSKVKVSIDMESRSLSFSDRSDGDAPLHSVVVCFSGPVRPAFWLFGLQPRNNLSFTAP